MEACNGCVHDCALLDEEGGHLGEDDRVKDRAEPNRKEAKHALDFLDLGDGAEVPGVLDNRSFVDGHDVVGVNKCGSIQEPCK